MIKQMEIQRGATIARSLVNNDKVHERLSYLKSRWSDEKKFEDIATYGENLAKVLPKGVHLASMSKKPFGAVVRIDGFTREYRLTLKTTRSSSCLRLDPIVEG